MFTQKMIIGMILAVLVSMSTKVRGIHYYVDPNGSDDANGLSWEDAFATIQKGIDANDATIVEVNEGIYYETIDFNGVACTLTSTDPYDDDVVAATIIDANGGSYGVYFHNYEDANSILTGFTIQNANHYGGIYCLGNPTISFTSPTITYCTMKNNWKAGIYCNYSNSLIKYCIIEGNLFAGIYVNGSPTIRYNIIRDNSSSGMYIYGSTAIIENNWIYDNGLLGVYIMGPDSSVLRSNTIVGNASCGVIIGTGNAEPTISNCILWDNVDNLNNCIATYSCIEDCNDANGIGNICGDANDPLFLDADANDFHIGPNSPCIDAGDPNGDYSGQFDIDDQPRVMVYEVDMGADEADYLPTDHNDYNEWVAVGMPGCWAYQRQCRGDADGRPQGQSNYWVSTNDNAVLIAAWNKTFEEIEGQTITVGGKEVELICADFDHAPQGRDNYRVSANDLAILIAYWEITNGPDPNCFCDE